MPPKKSTNTVLPPRRTTRSARKSIIFPSSSTVHNPPEIRSPPQKPKTAQKSSPNSIATKTTPKDFNKHPNPVPTQSEANPCNTNSELTPRIGVDLILDDKAEAAAHHMGSTMPDQIGGEQSQIEKAGAEKPGLETTGAKTKTVVKKTIRIVKKIVKKKVPKRVIKDQLDVQTRKANDIGEVEVENPIESVNVEVANVNCVESVSMEVENNSNTDDTVLMETDNSKCSVLVDDCVPNPTVVGSLEVERLSTDAEKQKESDVLEVDVEKQLVSKDLQVEEPSLVLVKREESEVYEGEKEDGSLTEKLSEVPGLEFDGAKNDGDEFEETVSATDTQLEDQNADPLRAQNHECTIENNLDLESGYTMCKEEVKDKVENFDFRGLKVEAEDVKEKVENSDIGGLKAEVEEVKEKVENNDIGDLKVEAEEEKEKVENRDTGGLKAEALSGDRVLLSGEMEALERRRRRKTEIFIGGLDKNTKEEDIRKIFEEVGEIIEVRLVIKNKRFAFVRYALAADAKKALEKHQKVEICGRQCGISPVEGNDTLFLGNIDKKWKNNDVTRLLHDIGIEKIDNVTVIADPTKIELNRGFAFLELETHKDAQTAYRKLQKKGILGKHSHIKVQWAEPLIEPDEDEIRKVKSVYAEHLPSSWDEEKVKDCFKKFGEIESVLLAKDMPTARRKDFAFVNYTSREAALACIEAFSHEQIDDKGSKVMMKVSLAKPIPKGQQMKHTRTPSSKELSKEKHKGTQPVIKQHEVGNMGKATSSNYEDNRVDQRYSTTSELVQLLREQASWRQTRPDSGIGSHKVEYSYPSPGMKRQYPVLGDDTHFSDPRWYPRARVESSHPIANASYSAWTRGVGMTSLPPHHRQGAGNTSGSYPGLEDYPSYVQARERTLYNGSGAVYRRY